jgi:hypothetical protein
MPQNDLLGIATMSPSEASTPLGRRSGCSACRDEALTASVHGICAEDPVFNWQSLWIDLGGEG